MERPLLDSYDLILDRDLAPVDDLPSGCVQRLLQGEADWRPFAAGLPGRGRRRWRALQGQLRRLDSVGAAENKVTYVMSGPARGRHHPCATAGLRGGKGGISTLVARRCRSRPRRCR